MKQEKLTPSAMSMDQIQEQASSAANYLKAMSHETRLITLCNLLQGPMSVSELEVALDAPQANISQHLAKLREVGLVSTKREGKSIYYSLADQDAMLILRVLYLKFCAENMPRPST